MRRVFLLDDFLRDFRYALRSIRKDPRFVSVTLFVLALGIGASVAVFSLINAVLLRALPYPDPGRLVYLWSPNPRFQLPLEYFTPMNADFFDLQRQNHSFASLSGWHRKIQRCGGWTGERFGWSTGYGEFLRDDGSGGGVGAHG
jgi:hypothetical protein